MNNIKLLACVAICSSLVAVAPAADTPAPGAGGSILSALDNALLGVSGQNVVDSTGKTVGKLQNLVMSKEGCVQLGVVNIGQGRLVGVPWQLITVQESAIAAAPGANANVGSSAANISQNILLPTGRTSQTVSFRLNMDTAKLQQAPTYTDTQVNNFVQQNIIQQYYTTFGVQQPHGGAMGGMSPGQDTTSGQQNQPGAIQGQQTQTNMWNQGQQQPSQPGGFNTLTNNNTGQGGYPGLPPTGLTNQPSPESGQITNNLPPGLEKRDTLPPGLQRDPLPPGLENRQSR